jgi:hypothetical protein
MLITRRPGPGTFIDVLDRVLDRGIIIDAWVRISLSGIDLVTIEARLVVASIETYLENAAPLSKAPRLSQIMSDRADRADE